MVAYKSMDAPLLRAQLISRNGRSVRACQGNPDFLGRQDADFPNVQSVPNAYANVGLECRWNVDRVQCDTCQDTQTVPQSQEPLQFELIGHNYRVHGKTVLSWISYLQAYSPTTTCLMNSRTSERHQIKLFITLCTKSTDFCNRLYIRTSYLKNFESCVLIIITRCLYIRLYAIVFWR